MALAVVWLIAAGPLWAAAGALILPRRYRRLGLDAGPAQLVGGLAGAATGPVGLGFLYSRTPLLRPSLHVGLPTALLVAEALVSFRVQYPDNVCVTNTGYVVNQAQTGLAVGLVYATMAVGLTLIYSVQRIVNFTHGQIFMLGGVTAYLLATGRWEVGPLQGILLAGLLAGAVGVVFERTMLGPMHEGKIERPREYAILVTFGFGLFLQFALVGTLGNPQGVRSPRYSDRNVFGLHAAAFDWGVLRIRTDVWMAGLIGMILILALAWFLRRTWMGMSLRAVSQDQVGAAVVGIPAGRTFTAAFGIGCLLAGMAGAALVPALNFPVPQIASQAAIRSFVIIVLGGMGSVPGALLGGVFVGLTEALGAGCLPDPNRAAAYQPAFPLLLFALVLLVRPRGFFGRAE